MEKKGGKNVMWCNTQRCTRCCWRDGQGEKNDRCSGSTVSDCSEVGRDIGFDAV